MIDEDLNLASTFAWLDFSEHERRKMLDVIELFGERATRDELGLGGVRDAFADLLFPGTSTIQTRAKYFLFVPWFYLLLEEKSTPSKNVAYRARKLESELMRAIELSNDTRGLIGKRAKENVRRLASSVYWLGLATWGILAFPGSQDQYHRSLDRFYPRRQGRRLSQREFDGESHEEPVQNWHPGLPPPAAGFPDGATFELSAPEAEYLRERVLASCSRSLLAHLLRERRELHLAEDCWDLAASVPPVFAEQLEHGRNFSEIMLGAQLLYNLMLAELRLWPEKNDEYRESLKDWSHLIAERHADFANWNRQRFWQIVLAANPHVSLAARGFINRWIDLVLSASNPAEIVDADGARSVVGDREYTLKRGQSRLRNRRALELWNGAAGSGQMDLRWNAARAMLCDVLDALGNRNDA